MAMPLSRNCSTMLWVWDRLRNNYSYSFHFPRPFFLTCAGQALHYVRVMVWRAMVVVFVSRGYCDLEWFWLHPTSRWETSVGLSLIYLCFSISQRDWKEKNLAWVLGVGFTKKKYKKGVFRCFEMFISCDMIWKIFGTDKSVLSRRLRVFWKRRLNIGSDIWCATCTLPAPPNSFFQEQQKPRRIRRMTRIQAWSLWNGGVTLDFVTSGYWMFVESIL